MNNVLFPSWAKYRASFGQGRTGLGLKIIQAGFGLFFSSQGRTGLEQVGQGMSQPLAPWQVYRKEICSLSVKENMSCIDQRAK